MTHRLAEARERLAKAARGESDAAFVRIFAGDARAILDRLNANDVRDYFGAQDMDAQSEIKLAEVHPDLVRVARATPQTPQAWRVDYGLRTEAAEAQAVATGHSKTMHSRHLGDPSFPIPGRPGECYAMAFDFCLLVNGAVSFDVSDQNTGGGFGVVAAQILATAERLGVKVQWGGQKVGAWVDCQVSHWRDWGHIQLDPSAYK